ncbi:MAG: DMT family transporter [Thermomicrobiales bacterium]|nr:DMT family transporter [Thermomicrobiales bacterium]
MAKRSTSADAAIPRSTVLAVAAVVAAAACWGALGVTYDLIGRHVDIEPVTLVTLRASAAAVVLLAAFSRHTAAKRDLAALRNPRLALAVVTMGLVSTAMFYVLLMFAYREAGVAVATVLLYVAPALVAIGSWLMYRIPVPTTHRIALVLAFVGVLGVAGSMDGNASWLGIALGLLSAMTYASYSLLARHALDHMTSLAVVTLTIAIGALALWPVKLIVDGGSLPSLTSIAVIAVVNGIGTTVAPMVLYTWGLSHLGPSRASLIATTEPAIAVLLAYMVLGERLAWIQIGGGLAIAAGVVLGSLGRSRR